MKPLDEMKGVLSSERRHKVEFLRLLIHAEHSQWFLEAGYSSLFALSTDGLNLSRSSALKRIVAARAGLRFPEILVRLKSGQLHFNAVVLLSPCLTSENASELIEVASGLSERKLGRLLAQRFPKEIKQHRDNLKWLDGESAEWTLTIDNELIELLDRAKQLMKHQHPSGDSVAVLKDILKKHLKSIDPMQRKTRPVKVKTSNIQTRYIQRGIQAQVWKKDDARCAYVSPDGKRCNEKAGLETDHKQAWAHGGRSDELPNLRLLCFAHNRWLAQKTFPHHPVFSKPKSGA